MPIPSRIALVAAATVITLAAPVPGRAQDRTSASRPNLTDARWQPWLGCWTPVERAPRDRDIQVCIVPTTEGGVRMATFAGDQRILDETISPDGTTAPMSEPGCRGSSRSVWAKSAARLFRTAELVCDGKTPQQTKGISTLEGADKWLDVQVVVVEGRDQVRARHYVRSSQPPPSAIAEQVTDLRRPDVVRIDATVRPDDVTEATAIAGQRAVEVWLSESTAQVPMGKRTLLALHDSNVPAHLIDLMVARAYPKRFEVKRSGSGGGGGSFGSFGSFMDDVLWASPFDLMFDPYAFYYSPFGSYRSFVDPTLYSLGGYITVPAAAQPSGNARVVNGSGYTRVEPRQPPVVGRTPGSSGDSFGSGGSSSSDGGSSAGSSGGGSASPAGYSSGGGGGQTAVPR